MSRCIECDYLAGSDRTPAWLFADGRGYCDHADREGGRWNVLQRIEGPCRCDRFKRADEARITQRVKALKVLRKRRKEK